MANRYCSNCGHALNEDSRFCPNCGRPAHEIAAVSTPEADVPVPPPPSQQQTGGTQGFGPTAAAPRQRSLVGRLFVGCAGLVVLGFLFVGCLALVSGGGDGGETAGSNNPPASEGDQPQAEKEERAAGGEQADGNQQKVFAIGDKVDVGDVSYTVTNARPETRLTDTYKVDPPKTGNFVVVDFTFANNGAEAVTMSDVGLYLYDSKNREYETDSDMFGYVPEDKDIFLLERVNPGLSQEAQVIYTVPPDASGFELEVTSGFFESEVKRIKLGF